MLSKSYHILLWEIKTTVVKRFYYIYLWILRRKKMVYFIKLLVASSKTPQTFHAIFLPRPMSAGTVSQPVIAYQNGNVLQISSTKHFAYSRIGSPLLCWPTPYSIHISLTPELILGLLLVDWIVFSKSISKPLEISF